MPRTIGGNPLAAEADRQGNHGIAANLRAAARRLRGAPKPYTDEQHAQAFAPIRVGILSRTEFAGKSHGGAFPTSQDTSLRRRSTGDRYGYASDWADLDNTR